MKILALEIELKKTDKINDKKILREEAVAVSELKQKGILREIYFDQNNCAVLILESPGKTETEFILSKFPLVKHGFIRFELKELHPYTGLARLDD